MTGTRAGSDVNGAVDDERRPSSALERLQARPVVLWVAAFALTLLVFYAMDHLIMGGQGLPLNIDLTPAQ